MQGAGCRVQRAGFKVQGVRPSASSGCAPGRGHGFRVRCRANMAYIRQSRLDSGCGIRVKALTPFELFLFDRER